MHNGLKFLAGISLLFSGCSSASIDDYSGHKPQIDLREYLNGDLEAWGVFINRSNLVDQQFHVAMQGKWNGNDGTLDEHFVYSDGKESDRTWYMHFTDDQHFKATAHDVIGEAQGTQEGNAVNIHYVLRVPVKDTTYDVSMDDWMYLMDDKTLINRTSMYKLGVKVGELVITFRKKN